LTSPALHVRLRPLRVTGSNFLAGERVTVIANVPPGMVTGRAVASDDGSFVVDFASVESVPRGFHVRATGSKGSAAIYAPRAWRISPRTT
jgi:hypothetical protein